MSPSQADMAARQRSWPAWAGLMSRLVVGGVMLVAGLLKVADLDGSAAAVQAYRLMPADLARVVGYALPVVEILLGLLLVAGLFTRVAALLSGLLLVGFVIGVVSVWVRGYSIDCGCFGGGGDVSPEGMNQRYTTEVVRDGFLIVLCAFLVLTPRTALSLDGRSARPPSRPAGALLDDLVTDDLTTDDDPDPDGGPDRPGDREDG